MNIDKILDSLMSIVHTMWRGVKRIIIACTILGITLLVLQCIVYFYKDIVFQSWYTQPLYIKVPLTVIACLPFILFIGVIPGDED